MTHILNINEESNLLHQLFKKISEGNTLLFLGAGASVTDKKYLSQQLINAYQLKINKNFETNDIVEFVDLLSADSSLDRNHFDNFVATTLSKLTPTESHKQLATIPWHTVITTNYDLLLENSFEQVRGTSEELYELKVVRNKNDFSYLADKSQLKYIKLNGCLSDKSSYPFVFSSKDFERASSFYKPVLNSFKNFSDRITFLSIGYSFSDPFAKKLVEKFDKYNFRQNKWMINVDPFVNEARLPFYSENKIQIIKCSFENFITKYKEWENKNAISIIKRKRLAFNDGSKRTINLKPKLQLNLNGVITQLSKDTKWEHINPKEFYEGEEPNFDIILRGLDIVKGDELSKAKEKIINELNNNTGNLIPLILFKGDFGSGKSTFLYRVINDLIEEDDDLISFEIMDYDRIRSSYLIELLISAKTKNIILYFNSIEIDSHFKSLNEIRADLSIEQFNTFNVIFLAGIRENILEKFKLTNSFANCHEINFTPKLNDNELEELIKRLNDHNIIELKDVRARKEVLEKIKRDYSNDSFLALMDIVSRGKHIEYLVSAYEELSGEAKNAFLFTSLLYRFKILMPSSLLNNIISKDWEHFRKKVIDAEGKGLLFQEINDSKDESADLFFKTKHAIISESLIRRIIGDSNEQYKYYTRLISNLDYNPYNSKILINLFKSLRVNNVLTKEQLEKLYDKAYLIFKEDPFFSLNYATNLQFRNTLVDLEKANSCLIMAETFLDKRNDKITHRRAVINFELARYHYNDNDGLKKTSKYLKDAEEFFLIKRIVDPFSSYSYADFIKMRMWCLDKIQYEEEFELKLRIEIEELLDVAIRVVKDNINRIIDLQQKYIQIYYNEKNEQEYLSNLEDYYLDYKTKPFALVLLYNFYWQRKTNFQKAIEYIEELEYFKERKEVVKCLFSHYGRNLNFSNNINKFFDLTRKNYFLEETDPIRFHYFSFIAESYNLNFKYAVENHLKEIHSINRHLNPDFNLKWLQPNDYKVREFEGKINKNSKGFFVVYISELGQSISLLKDEVLNQSLNIGDPITVNIKFFLFGLRAIIKANKKKN